MLESNGSRLASTINRDILITSYWQGHFVFSGSRDLLARRRCCLRPRPKDRFPLLRWPRLVLLSLTATRRCRAGRQINRYRHLSVLGPSWAMPSSHAWALLWPGLRPRRRPRRGPRVDLPKMVAYLHRRPRGMTGYGFKFQRLGVCE